MKQPYLRGARFAVAAALATAACSSATQGTIQSSRQSAALSPGEFDRLFLTSMIQHHRGAIEMVKELFGSYGAGQDETVFKFASDVNVDQTTEIARMEKMLAALTS